MLQIQNLQYSVAADGKQMGILRGIDLTVEPNHFMVITGPNGGGKTTLAKCIMGLAQPTGGSITWNGTDITALSITERAKLGVRYGFQHPPRFKGITVRDLLTVAAGKTLSHSEECSLLTQVGLCAKDYLDREVNTSLSGGEVKRIEIATVLAGNANLMIFDEPEAGIDLWSFSRLTETFGALRDKRNATILVISHQERILSMADSILMVSDGKISGRGTPAEILPQIVKDTVFTCKAMEPQKKGGNC